MDRHRNNRQSARVLEEERRGVWEVLAGVAANVAAVPVVLGLVALGGLLLATRAVRDVGQAFTTRDGQKPRRSRKARRVTPHPPSAQ